ncbi:extracellular solute-binding protein [uncultured Kiloniella sp.]|uniref:extracellular solute-binding protein n=1 Tax=uncultured Kiloniella sp. TaxID=1133091 RepID=UPI0034588C1C
MNDGLVRPLNDLVDKHGANIPDNLKITIDGNIMAIAFMANSQHLFSRTDILAQAGIDSVPGTYDEVIAAAKAIREAGMMEYPIVMDMKAGWNVGESFNLAFLAHGGEFFKAGSAEPTVNSEAGVAALETMKALVEYAHPDHLTQASNETQALWEAGEAALGIMWGSRGAAILDDEGSSEEVISNTVLSAAPSVEAGGVPGATLWWDGLTISTNVSDAEAEASFAALAGALTADMVAANNDDAVWLLDGFKPGAAAAGVAATAKGGAAPYPMLPQIGLLHNALGAELSDFLQGNESAEKALADVEAAYTTAAKEAGLTPKVVMPVDLFGQPANYPVLSAIAKENEMIVVADAAQSFGGALHGKRVGVLADYTTTSFFPAKPLGCYGDGGAILTDDMDKAEILKSIRIHGQGSDKYDNVRLGVNSRLDSFQAAVLIEKLSIFQSELEARDRIARRYCANLGGHVVVPNLIVGGFSSWAQYTVKVKERDRVVLALKERGIPTGVYYPQPLHTQKPYKVAPLSNGGLAVSEKLSREVLSLPMSSYLDEETQDWIVASVKVALGAW